MGLGQSRSGGGQNCARGKIIGVGARSPYALTTNSYSPQAAATMITS